MKGFPILGERLYLRSPSINVCFRTIIRETFDKKEIENVIEKVCIKHPFLNSFLEIDDENETWLVSKNDPMGIEYYKSNEMDFLTWYKKTDNTVFDFSHGPLVKFCVIMGTNSEPRRGEASSSNTEIIILGHHIIGDGIGYLNLLKDILLALDNRLVLNPQIPPYEDKDKYFKDTVLLDTGVHLYACGLNAEWRKSRVKFSEKEYLDFFKQYRNKYVPGLYMASVEGDNSKKILKKSRLNGLTVNELIASAFSVSAMETLNSKEIRLGVAVNIRNEIVSEPNVCMGNFVTGIAVKVNNDTSKDFISNAKAISSLLKEQLLNLKNRHMVVHFLGVFDKDLLEVIMPEAYGNLNHPVPKKLAELIGEQTENKGVGISNLGRYNFTGYNNFNVLDIQFIEPAFPANLLTVGVITVNNKFNFCLRYNEGEIKADAIKVICENAINLLR